MGGKLPHCTKDNAGLHKCQFPSDTVIGSNVVMMRVYIFLVVVVVVLVIVAMCQFQDENRQHTSNAPSDKLAPKWTR